MQLSCPIFTAISTNSEPAPGSVELLRLSCGQSRSYRCPAGPVATRLHCKGSSTRRAREAVVPRAQTGILGLALGTFFDYYVTYVVSAEVGLIQRWFERGLSESPETMARIMTGSPLCVRATCMANPSISTQAGIR